MISVIVRSGAYASRNNARRSAQVAIVPSVNNPSIQYLLHRWIASVTADVPQRHLA
jgi:hypothetical protein